MPWIAVGALGLLGIVLAVKTVLPMTRRRRKFEVDNVSEQWVSQQRGRSQD
jgi:hypothetical protein